MKIFPIIFVFSFLTPSIWVVDDKILEVLNLKDGTFDYIKNERVFEINLINLRKPNQIESILGDPERDCTLVFEIKNQVGWRLLYYNASVYAINLDEKYINTMGGITHINAFNFEELSNSKSTNTTIAIQEMCKI